ncbi:MAG: prepilin-type N-terminal cleavage/methylation domain-containing protein [Candidatus Omnitrophota bacterium]|jgi:prepilin-type N-terminal cleavage/methylation domain-containing protein|nr:MAG: prepilin-type N-terminal cleavage/methylation domain-containing protein [Candidatus Omnitrophota bacterium]
MHQNNCRSLGFTLIELLIVVAIIGILAAIAVPNFLNAQVKAKISKVRGDMHSLSLAIEAYHIDQNHYPWFNEYNYPGRYNSITYRLIPLTTPVSYLNSLNLEDPFLELMGAEGYEDDLPRFSYNYRNHLFFNPPFKVWILNSMGPDRTANQGLQTELWARGLVAADAVIIYNITNGLLSAGDMPQTGGETKFRMN